MKAAVIYKFGGPESFQLVDLPKPTIKSDQLLVKVLFASINPIEMVLRRGGMRVMQGSKFPKVLGSDFCGVVENIGNKICGFKKGDIVFGMMDIMKGGTYAEYISVQEKHISLAPKNFTPNEAAGIPLVSLTSYQAFKYLTDLKKGDHILINGASGGVGVYAVQLAKAFGATVTAVTSDRNIELVKSLGADRVIDYNTIDLLQINEEIDYFYDAYGNYNFHKTKHLLSSSGVYVTTIPKVSHFISSGLTIWANKKAKVVVVKPNGTDLAHIKSMCEEGLIIPIIDSTFALQEMEQAHERLQTKRARGKIIIQVADL